MMLDKTDPSLVDFEMDLYWVVFGGGDPLDFFNRHPKRFAMVHVKDSGGPPDNKIVDVGKGTIDFPKIFAQSDKAGSSTTSSSTTSPPIPLPRSATATGTCTL